MKFSLLTAVPYDRTALRLTARSIVVQQNAPEIEWITGALSAEMQAMLSEIFTDADTSPVFITAPDTAIQTMLASATGDYVWLLPAGTTLADAFALRDVAQAVTRHGASDFFWGDAVDAFGPREAGDLYQLQHGLITPVAAMLFRRKKIVGLLPPQSDDMTKLAYTLTARLAADETATKTYLPRLLCEDQEFIAAPTALHVVRDDLFQKNLATWTHNAITLPMQHFLHHYMPKLVRRWRLDRAKKRHLGGKDTKGRTKPRYAASKSRHTLSN